MSPRQVTAPTGVSGAHPPCCLLEKNFPLPSLHRQETKCPSAKALREPQEVTFSWHASTQVLPEVPIQDPHPYPKLVDLKQRHWPLRRLSGPLDTVTEGRLGSSISEFVSIFTLSQNKYNCDLCFTVYAANFIYF